MFLKPFFVLFLSAISLGTYSQESKYLVSTIPDSLKTNANAVIRLSQLDLVLSSQRSMTYTVKRVVTVLNEAGLSAIDAYAHYDKNRNIQNIQAIILDGLGNEIKKIKRKDFKDHSAADGFSIFSDSRVLYLDYTPINYPFTIIYDCQVQTSATAFLPQWFPIPEFSLSVEKSVLNVVFPDNLGFKKKESNFATKNISKKIDSNTHLSYEAANLVANKPETNAPYYEQILPNVKLGLEFFHLEGVDGKGKTWVEFGQWISEKLLAGTTQLPPETIAKIKLLVGLETDPIKKAKIVYDFVQQKVRYVSIQVGIGGWKPMLASDVDRLGYGDCKALTNYTQALLAAVDVPSYYTILYGSSSKMDIDADFVSMQGNHAILSIPMGDKYIGLECTSQTNPFGFQANFTDDRNVLIIKPDGGQIVRTKVYDAMDNSQISNGSYAIAEDGAISGVIKIVSKGTQYGNKEDVERMASEELEKHYKEYWDDISNLKVTKIGFNNNKEDVVFTENGEIAALNYGTFTGGKMIFVVNAYNRYSGGVKRIRNRKMPLEIARGYYDQDEIQIHIPTGFGVEFLPKDFESKTKFGHYTISFVKTTANTILYKRVFHIRTGQYTNTEYDEYRLFLEQVNQNDNAKIILTKSL